MWIFLQCDVSPDMKKIISSFSDQVNWLDTYGLRLLNDNFSFFTPEASLMVAEIVSYYWNNVIVAAGGDIQSVNNIITIINIPTLSPG